MRLAQMPYEPVTEVIHGVTVVDPYRWLEDRSKPATQGWIEKQKQTHVSRAE